MLCSLFLCGRSQLHQGKIPEDVISAVSALQGGNRQKVGRFSDSPRPTPTLQAFIAHRILNILGHLMGHPFDFGPKTSLGSPTVHWKPRHPHPVDLFLISYRKPRCISSSKWTTATTSAGRETDSGWRVAHDNVLQRSSRGNILWGRGHMFHLYRLRLDLEKTRVNLRFCGKVLSF